MKVSLNTLKKYVDIDIPVSELVGKINAQLGQVEEVIDLAARFKDVRIVKVVAAAKHSNADTLTVCRINDGNSVEGVERDSEGLVQVVCGAPNVSEGMWAVWLPPGSVVPVTYGEADPFILEARPLRGEVSQGMLAAGDELGINSDHAGIIEIKKNDLPKEYKGELAPGLSFAEIFELNDVVIDIENKMFTHRPDLFGQLGVAREIFAILQPEVAKDKKSNLKFKEEAWYDALPDFKVGEGLELNVFNDVPVESPRFMAVALSGIQVKPSPLWLQTTLFRWGSKSINNIVDLTNYIMLFTAQPTHAYDYDKIRGHNIGVRMAEPEEKVTLLNGKTYTLSKEDIVIADGGGVIGLAGVMGGLDSEVSDETTNIILECANFNMYTVRKTSMRYGLFTDAVTRFNKGQSPLQAGRVMSRLMALASGKQASAVHDLPENSNLTKASSVHPPVDITATFISERLGLTLNNYEVSNLLAYVGFTINHASKRAEAKKAETVLSIESPFWRTDIVEPEDIVEEVGRLHGYGELPTTLPSRTIRPVTLSPARSLQRRIRHSLAALGANEVLTYSFVPEKTIDKAGQDVSKAFRLTNALSPELEYYRLTPLPSLLERIHPNIKAGHSEFILYEIGKGHTKNHLTEDDGLPKEFRMVDFVYANKKKIDGAAFYKLRRVLDELTKDLYLEFVYKEVPEPLNRQFSAPFDESRSALIETINGHFIGMIGELKPAVSKNFKLPEFVAAATLDFDALEEVARSSKRVYRPLSKFPSITQDMTLRVKPDTLFEIVETAVKEELAKRTNEGLSGEMKPVGIYSPEDASHKTMTFSFTISHQNQTLTDAEVDGLLNSIALSCYDAIGAERV